MLSKFDTYTSSLLVRKFIFVPYVTFFFVSDWQALVLDVDFSVAFV